MTTQLNDNANNADERLARALELTRAKSNVSPCTRPSIKLSEDNPKKIAWPKGLTNEPRTPAKKRCPVKSEKDELDKVYAEANAILSEMISTQPTGTLTPELHTRCKTLIDTMRRMASDRRKDKWDHHAAIMDCKILFLNACADIFTRSTSDKRLYQAIKGLHLVTDVYQRLGERDMAAQAQTIAAGIEHWIKLSKP